MKTTMNTIMKTTMNTNLHVLFASFEAVPFIKSGGLGDVAGSLPIALKQRGIDIRVILPKLSAIPDEYKQKMEHITSFRVQLGWRNQYCGIEMLSYRGVTFYFLDNEYYFYRDQPYGYYDDGERIAFFAKAIVDAIPHIPDFPCNILHCNDWHTALSPIYLRELYQDNPALSCIKTIFTIHNLKFQGQMSSSVLGDVLGLDQIPNAVYQLCFDADSINYMKGALCYSDILTTVSPTYALEIQHPYFGEHLDYIFRDRCSILHGIINGIDTTSYNCTSDPLICANYDINHIKGKRVCKVALQKELGLIEDTKIPIIAMIGRLTSQKGLDLVDRMMDETLSHDLQMVILGTGDPKFENMFRYYEAKYPDKLRALIKFDEALSHRIYSGADLLLMPSQFEPCGLSQMIAMAYGTLPIVRETGGLKDTVTPYNQYTGKGTGFSFANYNAHEMYHTIMLAIDLFNNNQKQWRSLMKQAMKLDFSWNTPAKEYERIYHSLIPESCSESCSE